MKVWRTSPQNFGQQKDIMSLVMTQEQGQYCWPTGFGFDNNYNEKIIFKEDSSENYKFNADEKMEHLRSVV